jgi:hypothetical protein
MGQNGLISFLNILNFILFMVVSKGYDVNEILSSDAYVDSYTM